MPGLKSCKLSRTLRGIVAHIRHRVRFPNNRHCRICTTFAHVFRLLPRAVAVVSVSVVTVCHPGLQRKIAASRASAVVAKRKNDGKCKTSLSQVRKQSVYVSASVAA